MDAQGNAEKIQSKLKGLEAVMRLNVKPKFNIGDTVVVSRTDINNSHIPVFGIRTILGNCYEVLDVLEPCKTFSFYRYETEKYIVPESWLDLVERKRDTVKIEVEIEVDDRYDFVGVDEDGIIAHYSSQVETLDEHFDSREYSTDIRVVNWKKTLTRTNDGGIDL